MSASCIHGKSPSNPTSVARTLFIWNAWIMAILTFLTVARVAEMATIVSGNSRDGTLDSQLENGNVRNRTGASPHRFLPVNYSDTRNRFEAGTRRFLQMNHLDNRNRTSNNDTKSTKRIRKVTNRKIENRSPNVLDQSHEHRNDIPHVSVTNVTENSHTTYSPNFSMAVETQISAQQPDVDKYRELLDGMNSDPPATQIQMPELDGRKRVEVTAWSRNGFPLVEDGIFWSKQVEDLIPKGTSDGETSRFMESASTLPIASMQPGKWNRCGRPKNHHITFQDGTSACARYRDPQNTLIQGEVLSFYLSKMLGFDNVPAVILSRLNPSADQWRNTNFTSAEWTSNKLVAMIQWINDLSHEKSRVKMPQLLLSAYKGGSALSGSSFNSDGHEGPDVDDHLADQLIALSQWTDLILFDYITGHYDRVASMQDGAEREQKPSIITENIRNLRQTWQNGKLFLIDNESGLLDGYELIYRGRQTGQLFFHFHRRMLNSTCLFRRQTIERIRWLVHQDRPDRTLEKYTRSQELLYDSQTFPWTPEYELFRKHFHERLRDVVDWIDTCRSSSRTKLEIDHR